MKKISGMWLALAVASSLCMSGMTRAEEAEEVATEAARPGIGKGTPLAESLVRAREEGKLEIVRDLGAMNFRGWMAMTDEAMHRVVTDKVLSGNSALLFSITMDHNHAGDGNNLLGWPRLRQSYRGGTDLSGADYLLAWIRVESDLDGRATPLRLSVRTGERAPQPTLFTNVEENVWFPVVVDLKDCVNNVDDLKNVESIQFWIQESDFPDKKTVRFYFDEILLVKMQE